MTDRDAATIGPRASSPAIDAQPAQDRMIGTMVAGRFRVLSRVGEGGMGAVYVAEHTALAKRVAIKILHAEMHSNAEMRARFEREAVAMARLEHENIVSASDFGQLDDGSFFLAMEFIEGRSLREVAHARGRLSLLSSLKILRQISSALARAHALGIVHRDLKPENILIVQRGLDEELVKIIDFGIARVTGPDDGERPLTQTGVVFGTPHYMAPEQALGRRVDAAADQYAFGVLAFELLTGQKPFDHKNLIELLDLQVSGAIPRATSVAPELPASIDYVFDRVLAKSPLERYGSITDAMDAIDACLGPVVAQGAGAFASTVPADSTGAVPHDKTLLASQIAVAAATSSGAPTVSNTAPTIQDSRTPTLVEAPAHGGAFVPPARVWGLPVVELGRLGRVPVIAMVLVGLTSALALGSGLRALTHRAAPREGERAPTSARLAAFRGERTVANALQRAATGDVNAAIEALRARRAANPGASDDSIAAYQLAMLYAANHQPTLAASTFADATSKDPALAEDEPLGRTMLRLLDDESASGSVETLLHAQTFAQSRTLARLLVEETIYGRTQDARRRAGRLARERLALLDPSQRAQVVLRTADRCDEIQSVLSQAASLASTPAAADINRLRARQCAMLSRRALCACIR